MSKTCCIIVLGLFFIGAVILLEYVIRRAVVRKQENVEIAKWDKYDTLTAVLATIVAIIFVVVALVQVNKRKANNQNILSDVRWPQITPERGPIDQRQVLQELSPEPLLGDARYLETPQGYLLKQRQSTHPSDFNISTVPSSLFQSSSSVSSPITPYIPQVSEKTWQTSSPLLVGSAQSSSQLTDPLVSSTLTQPSSVGYLSPPVIPSGALTPPRRQIQDPSVLSSAVSTSRQPVDLYDFF